MPRGASSTLTNTPMSISSAPEPCFAVAGRPILASRSAPLFQALFERQGLNARYTRLSVEDADELLAMADDLGLSGLNVTAPLKERVLGTLAARQTTVDAVGAAKVLLPTPEGWVGANTDAMGVRDTLALHGVDLAGRRAVVLGAGGAARAALASLSNAGLTSLLVCNRTAERGERVAANFRAETWPLDRLGEAVRGADLLVSCVPGEPDLVPSESLHPGLWVFDADYRATRLARIAHRAGARVIPGTDWLALQASAGFEAFTGQALAPATVTWVRRLATSPVTLPSPPLVLCGFMGAGKSTLAPRLADLLGWSFADTDRMVEETSGMTVAAIFERCGEARFRELERHAVNEAVDRAGVVALGGGALLDPEVRDFLRGRAVVVLLWTPLDSALARTDGTDRPLLASGADPSRLRRSRHGSYLALADLVVSSATGTPDNVARVIVGELRASGLEG